MSKTLKFVYALADALLVIAILVSLPLAISTIKMLNRINNRTYSTSTTAKSTSPVLLFTPKTNAVKEEFTSVDMENSTEVIESKATAIQPLDEILDFSAEIEEFRLSQEISEEPVEVTSEVTEIVSTETVEETTDVILTDSMDETNAVTSEAIEATVAEASVEEVSLEAEESDYFQRLREIVPATEENIRQLACVMKTEAEGCSSNVDEELAEMVRVGKVLLNRILTDYYEYQNVTDIISAVTPKDQYPGSLARIQSGYVPRDEILQVAEALLNGEVDAEFGEDVYWQTGFVPGWNCHVVYTSPWHYYSALGRA